jgi:Fe-Mn family superoxide dismutase
MAVHGPRRPPAPARAPGGRTEAAPERGREEILKHEAKNFDHLLGQVDGLSDAQLKAHFTLYQGYVAKLNEIEEKLRAADVNQANFSYAEFSELKRRESVPFNGTFLHELYFENLAPNRGQISASLRKRIEEDFGSLDAWQANMKGCAITTLGWVFLTYNRFDRKLHTYIADEHQNLIPIHQELILVLDTWEHAFFIDYGTKKADYVGTFFKNVNWNVVNERADRIMSAGR